MKDMEIRNLEELKEKFKGCAEFNIGPDLLNPRIENISIFNIINNIIGNNTKTLMIYYKLSDNFIIYNETFATIKDIIYTISNIETLKKIDNIDGNIEPLHPYNVINIVDKELGKLLTDLKINLDDSFIINEYYLDPPIDQEGKLLCNKAEVENHKRIEHVLYGYMLNIENKIDIKNAIKKYLFNKFNLTEGQFNKSSEIRILKEGFKKYFNQDNAEDLIEEIFEYKDIKKDLSNDILYNVTFIDNNFGVGSTININGTPIKKFKSPESRGYKFFYEIFNTYSSEIKINRQSNISIFKNLRSRLSNLLQNINFTGNNIKIFFPIRDSNKILFKSEIRQKDLKVLGIEDNYLKFYKGRGKKRVLIKILPLN